jgi:hypothetical protein
MAAATDWEVRRTNALDGPDCLVGRSSSDGCGDGLGSRSYERSGRTGLSGQAVFVRWARRRTGRSVVRMLWTDRIVWFRDLRAMNTATHWEVHRTNALNGPDCLVSRSACDGRGDGLGSPSYERAARTGLSGFTVFVRSTRRRTGKSVVQARLDHSQGGEEARELGFEPRIAEPKSAVLPLHHSRVLVEHSKRSRDSGNPSD